MSRAGNVCYCCCVERNRPKTQYPTPPKSFLIYIQVLFSIVSQKRLFQQHLWWWLRLNNIGKKKWGTGPSMYNIMLLLLRTVLCTVCMYIIIILVRAFTSFKTNSKRGVHKKKKIFILFFLQSSCIGFARLTVIYKKEIRSNNSHCRYTQHKITYFWYRHLYRKQYVSVQKVT